MHLISAYSDEMYMFVVRLGLGDCTEKQLSPSPAPFSLVLSLIFSDKFDLPHSHRGAVLVNAFFEITLFWQ